MKSNTLPQLVTLSIAASIANHALAGPPPAIEPRAQSENPLNFYNGALVFEIEERLRWEIRENNRDFDSSVHSVTDGGWLLNRFRFGLTVQPAPWLKVYAQGQDAREFFSDRKKIPGVAGAEGDDAFDLRQGYAEIGNLKEFPLTLKVGRQVINYGDRRIIGESYWSNFGGRFWLESFFARPVQNKRAVFDDDDAADNLGGVYFSTSLIPKQRTELYYFYCDKSDNQPDLAPANTIDPRGTGNGPAARYSTIGTRIKSNAGELGGWDYDAEAAYEFGDVWVSDRNSQKQSLHAFAAHAAGGYTFEDALWKPRAGLEYDYASGDRNPNDSSSQSFQTSFSSNHEKYGFIDLFAWRNVHDARVQLKIDPTKNLDLELDYHAFWLADTRDFWFTSNGQSSLRTKTPDGRDVRTIGARNFAGHEIDFVAKWSPREWLKLEAGYSHFFAGSYLQDTGPSDDADFGYVMTTFAF